MCLLCAEQVFTYFPRNLLPWKEIRGCPGRFVIPKNRYMRRASAPPLEGIIPPVPSASDAVVICGLALQWEWREGGFMHTTPGEPEEEMHGGDREHRQRETGAGDTNEEGERRDEQECYVEPALLRRVFTLECVRDVVEVTWFPERRDGLITYVKENGDRVHTLNTPSGFRRKLESIGLGEMWRSGGAE